MFTFVTQCRVRGVPSSCTRVPSAKNHSTCSTPRYVATSGLPANSRRYVACSKSFAASAKRAASISSGYVMISFWIASQSSNIDIPTTNSGSEAVEHLARALQAPHDGRTIPLGLDLRSEDLELEDAFI